MEAGAVAAHPFAATVSVGVAISDDASIDLSALLTAADQALYRAKEAGRNRATPQIVYELIARPVVSAEHVQRPRTMLPRVVGGFERGTYPLRQHEGILPFYIRQQVRELLTSDATK
jgi:hypothetical protein